MNVDPTAAPAVGRRGLARWFVPAVGAVGVATSITLVAVCTAQGHRLPAALFVVALLVAALMRAVTVREWGNAVFLFCNLALMGGVLLVAGPREALSLTVVVVQASVSAVFFRSLVAGRTDLVTQLALAVRFQRSERELAYTRGVTWAWAWFMGGLAVFSFAFGFAAPPRLWWWWENVFATALPFVFALAEWLFRLWYLRGETRTGVREAFRALVRVDYRRLFQV